MFSNFIKNKRIQAAFTVDFERRIISWCDVFGQRDTNSGKIITEFTVLYNNVYRTDGA